MGSTGRAVVAHDLGELNDFPDGHFRIIEVEGDEIGVYRRGAKLYAVRNLCPHRGAPICKGEVRGTMLPSEPGQYTAGLDGRILHCPWHRWEFDLETGRSPFGIDKRRLITYAIQIQRSRVVLHVPVRVRERQTTGSGA